MCIVLFRKDCIGIYNSVIETLLSYFTEIKIASAPYYVIESVSDISKIPHVKLFILVCDSAINYGSGSRDIRLATIKVLKTWGGEFQCPVLTTFPATLINLPAIKDRFWREKKSTLSYSYNSSSSCISSAHFAITSFIFNKPFWYQNMYVLHKTAYCHTKNPCQYIYWKIAITFFSFQQLFPYW